MDSVTNKILANLLKKPLFSAGEAREGGAHPSLLGYYVKKGFVERVGRGFYKSAFAAADVDFQWEDLFITARSVPNGAVCLLSALALYELTDEIPRRHWIAVPHSTTAPKRQSAVFVRFRDMTLGKTSLKLRGGAIPIFNRERTIVDSFRHLSAETALKALKEGLKSRGKQKISIRKL